MALLALAGCSEGVAPPCAVGACRATGPPGSQTPELRLTKMPESVPEARDGQAQRLENVVRAWTCTFRDDWDDLGDWSRDVPRTGLRKIMAGLEAMRILPEGDPDRPPPDFPRVVERWVERESRMDRHAGTDTSANPVGGSEGDYDFTMLQILELIHHFEDHPELLSNDAIWALLHNERSVVRRGRGRRLKTRIPEVGNWPHRMTFDVVVGFPETENHVLLTNVWAYLVNQWLERNPRNDPRVARYFRKDPAAYRNAGSRLEQVLRSVVSRPLYAGFFETNARPYQAYSLRALQLLYSYADASTPGGRKLKLAAQSALDYAATKFAFQSFEGKRLAPLRRNHKYRYQLGVYQGDYVPFLFGVLTGAHVYDDSPRCRGERCGYRLAQARGFALESALSRYRVPDLVWDFMLRPDNHRAGHGVWARMQSRFTERHYLQGKWPRYLGHDPNLERAVRRGRAELEPAPEFYFITRRFMNSAGGRFEHYSGMDAWLPRALWTSNDLFSRPSTLLLPGDNGYWRNLGQLEEATLAFAGDSARYDRSNNTGVYKNFVYGYSAHRGVRPLTPPGDWTPRAALSLGALDLALVDLSAENREANPDYGLYVLLGTLAPRVSSARTTAFWEVIPATAVAGVDALLGRFLERNAARRFEAGVPNDYALCLSGDVLTLNPDYGLYTNPFLRVNGTRAELSREHADLQDESTLSSFPLLEAREVDANFRYTHTTYALAHGDGRLVVENPYRHERLSIDLANPEEPRRELIAIGESRRLGDPPR